MQQFDVKHASLYGDLEEEIYMEIPQGFKSEVEMVCKLNKACMDSSNPQGLGLEDLQKLNGRGGL